jgi:hypothetical protein
MSFFKRNGRSDIREKQRQASADPLSLGCLLTSAGVAIEAIQDALEFQRDHSDEMLGRILVEHGVISQEYLDLMLQKQHALRNASTADTIGVMRAVTNQMQPPKREHEALRTIALGIAQVAGKVTR